MRSSLSYFNWGAVVILVYNGSMQEVPIILIGYGGVGRAFERLVGEKSGEIRERHGLFLRIRTVIRRGSVRFSEGERQDASKTPEEPKLKQRPEFPSLLKDQASGVLVVCTASSHRTGEPGLPYMHTALNHGWHVVTADKGPLIADWTELNKAASACGCRLKISGATAAALPTLDVALGSLAGSRILSFQGILNGTTNFILTRMGQGLDFGSALQEARDRGIAEPDPSLDVEGWDTAAKVLLLTNSICSGSYSLDEVEVQGIPALPSHLEEKARGSEKTLKLLGEMNRGSGGVRMSVRPRILERDHPLFSVNGTEKGITFSTDTMGEITLIGGRSDPRGAAAALLKDLITIYADIP